MDIDNDNDNDSAVDSDDDNLSTMNLRPRPDRGNATSATSNRRTSNNNNGTAVATGRNQRPRLNEIIFDPTPEYGSTSYDPNLRRLFSSNRFESVTLQDLRDIDSLRTVNYIDVQILRIIVQPRGANNQAFTYSNNRGRPGARRQVNQINYSRLFLIRIHNHSEGDRVAYMMESKSTNQVLWNRNIEYRDNGTVTIGSIIRILSPRPVDGFMPNNVPLITTQFPVVVMTRSKSLLSIGIKNLVEQNASFAFCQNHIKVSLSPVFYAVRTTCSGLFCDRQRLNDWSNENERGCGCYAMHHRRSSIAIQHDIVLSSLESRPENPVTMNLFSSNKFTSLYLSEPFSPNVTLSQLDMASEEYFNVMECMENAVNFINNNEGFTAIGWYKNGTINDRTLVSNHATNGTSNGVQNGGVDQQNQVNSSEVNYRIIELMPTNRDFLDKDTVAGRALNRLKYNVSFLHVTI